jgi:hypothetical protein
MGNKRSASVLGDGDCSGSSRKKIFGGDEHREDISNKRVDKRKRLSKEGMELEGVGSEDIEEVGVSIETEDWKMYIDENTANPRISIGFCFPAKLV